MLKMIRPEGAHKIPENAFVLLCTDQSSPQRQFRAGDLCIARCYFAGFVSLLVQLWHTAWKMASFTVASVSLPLCR